MEDGEDRGEVGWEDGSLTEWLRPELLISLAIIPSKFAKPGWLFGETLVGWDCGEEVLVQHFISMQHKHTSLLKQRNLENNCHHQPLILLCITFVIFFLVGTFRCLRVDCDHIESKPLYYGLGRLNEWRQKTKVGSCVEKSSLYPCINFTKETWNLHFLPRSFKQEKNSLI